MSKNLYCCKCLNKQFEIYGKKDNEEIALCDDCFCECLCDDYEPDLEDSMTKIEMVKAGRYFDLIQSYGIDTFEELSLVEIYEIVEWIMNNFKMEPYSDAAIRLKENMIQMNRINELIRMFPDYEELCYGLSDDEIDIIDEYVFEDNRVIEHDLTPLDEKSIPRNIYNLIISNETNKLRTVNLVILEDKNFELTYNAKTYKYEIQSKPGTIYSEIPFDTCKNYMVKALFNSLVQPNEFIAFIDDNELEIKDYIVKALKSISVNPNQSIVNEVFDSYKKDPLLMVQIVARILQSKDTGSIETSLAEKFLPEYKDMAKINSFLNKALLFCNHISESLNLDENILCLCNNMELNSNHYISDTNELDTIKQQINSMIEQTKSVANYMINNATIEEAIKKEKRARKDEYTPKQNFYSKSQTSMQILWTDQLTNHNRINVISDTHWANPKDYPVFSDQFNIIAGDIIELKTKSNIKGICVLGNHDIFALTYLMDNCFDILDKFGIEYNRINTFEQIKVSYRLSGLDEEEADKKADKIYNSLSNFNISLNYETLLKDDYFKLLIDKFQKMFPHLKVLYNESYMYEGVRYIGLNIPECYSAEKVKVQKLIYEKLKSIIGGDYGTPTVIISHAPISNEFGILDKHNSSYRKLQFLCNQDLYNLIMKTNIKGFIHGHHHITSKSKYWKFIEIENKRMFIVCSIFSRLNNGIDLSKFLMLDNYKAHTTNLDAISADGLFNSSEDSK